MSTETSINIRHFLIVALGGNPFLHSYIDELYMERRWEYYELYKNGDISKDMLIPMHVTHNEEKMKQAAGIVEWCYKHNDFEKVYRLIKKGYKFSYQYVQQQGNKPISFDQFELAFMRKRGGVENVTDLSLFYASCIVLYLCNKENKAYNFGSYGKMMIQAMKDLEIGIIAYEIRFAKEYRDKHKEEVSALFALYGIPRNMKEMSIGKFLELFIERQMAELGSKNPFINAAQARSIVFREGISKYIGSISNWIKVHRINEMDLTESVIITKDDVEVIFLDFLIAKQKNSNNLTDNDRDLYIVSTLYLKTIINVYLETKKLYLDDSQEQHYLEVQEKEKSIKQKELDFNKQEAELKERSKLQDDRISGLEEELKKTQRALQIAQSELEKREDNAKEVASLREYVYELNNEAPIQQEVKEEELVERIQRRKVAVIGGDQNWIKKMREILPEVKFVEIESINRDLSYVDNLDAVFVYWSIFKHNFYKKFIKQMAQNDTQLYYLSRTTNAELVLREMEKTLRQKK